MTKSIAKSPGEDLIVLATAPMVAESPLQLQSEKLTPSRRFFVRNHFGIPDQSPSAWSVGLGTGFTRPSVVDLAELRELPARRLDAVIECAGNGRRFLPTPWEGNPFAYGAVSAASWTGVSLSEVLGVGGLPADVEEVVFVGSDHGFERNVGADIAFERSLPLEVALHPDTILAYAMNDEPLPREHGGPVRLLVPGWYGVASVKWLAEIRVLNHRFDGYFQTRRYVLPRGDKPAEPLRERRVRAIITNLTSGETVVAHSQEVRGLAWSGNQAVTSVEFSSDGGATWRPADLEPTDSAYSWQRWRAEWVPSTSGVADLKVRATDARGRTQPDASEWNLLGYANNGIQVVTVTVEG